MVTTVNTHIQDEFSTDDYSYQGSKSIANLITVQKSKSVFGLFISDTNSDHCDFINEPKYPTFTYTYKNGEEDEGYLIPNPRILVLKVGDFIATTKDQDMVGIYSKGDKDRGLKVSQYFLVYLLGADNSLLHHSPLSWKTSGVSQFYLDSSIKVFRKEFEESWALSRNEEKSRKNHKFHSLTVFCPKFEVVSKGQGNQKNPALTVTGYEKPTSENVLDYFVGYDSKLKSKIHADFDEYVDFGTWEYIDKNINKRDGKGSQGAQSASKPKGGDEFSSSYDSDENSANYDDIPF